MWLKVDNGDSLNSNDEIIPNTNWEFQSKNGGLDYFRIYVQ